ncbi:hypothetical protein [Methyloligella halotolerans]|nr:hypothetical protein [Methyloligella halotolerans]
MRPDFLGGRPSAGIIALAFVAGIIASQIVLLLTAGSVGIPGVYSVHVIGEKHGASVPGEPSAATKPRSRTTPPPIATPAPPDGEQLPQATTEAPEADSPPVAQPSVPQEADRAASDPDATAGKPAKPEVEPTTPSNGPVGWEGPRGAPGSAPESEGEAVLDGPIDLDVGDAVTDLNLEEANENDADKDKDKDKNEKKENGEASPSGGPAPSAQPAPPPAAGASGEREVLPWEATVPDPQLMAPVDVPEGTPEFSLPAADAVKGWLQGRASNAASGNTRYELWLEPPMDMRLRLTAVGYQFKPASGEMITRLSRKPESGFRVSFEAAACEGSITLVLTYKDGRSHKVPVDSCNTFN